MLAAALAAAARAAGNASRGTLLWRVNGRECRLTSFDTLAISGGGLPPITHQVEGIDLAELA